MYIVLNIHNKHIPLKIQERKNITELTGQEGIKVGIVNPKTIPSLGVMTLLDCLSDFHRTHGRRGLHSLPAGSGFW